MVNNDILVVGDVHFVNTSYIKDRLDYCVDSLNWVEQEATKLGVKKIIYVGDFFDRSDVNAEEISALAKVQWSNCEHIVIVGNHELSKESNSVLLLQFLGFKVISEIENIDGILYVPYLYNPNKFDYSLLDNADIAISHNDIAGIQVGKFKTVNGLDLEKLKRAKLFINGHIHNGSYLADNVLNIGNFVGLNFSEDAFKYQHNVALVDNGKVELIENPYTLNFYHLTKLSELSKIKDNAVVSFRCSRDDVDTVTKKLESNKKIKYFKVLLYSDVKTTKEAVEEKLNKVNHIELFQSFMLEKLGTDKMIKEEVESVCK
jgi:calcineurin-like phosphoesterase